MWRPCFLCIVAVAFPGYHLMAGDDGKKDDIKWDRSQLEKSLENDFDLKLKSWTVGEEAYPDAGSEKKEKCYRLLLEFTKDVDPNVYKSRGLPFGNSRKGGGPDKPYIEFYYFDEDNVRLRSERNSFDRIDGDVTLKKGEAFRVFIFDSADAKLLSKTKRIEVHLQIPKKKAN